ncbi:sensor histidine kinase [Saccharopolyspora sp. 5N102]|uniref:sensor histidine kinase n=1 Tax=Saccharopolyspora sp. 5N102 TaxID=3375155 RepID=UPI0037900F13
MSPLVEKARAAAAQEARGVRAAPRQAVAGELAAFLVVLGIGFVPSPASLLPSSHFAVTAATACWSALLVPARRRWPVATLLATAPVFASDNIWAAATLPFVTFSVARRITPARRLWLAVLATAVVDLLLSVVREWNAPGGLGETLAGFALTVAFLLLLPALSGGVLGRRQPLVRLLRERNQYLERAQELTAEKARLKERAHIATEMHDMLGHRLSLISMHAGALEITAAKDAPRFSGQAELLRTTAATAMAELREILGVLNDTQGSPPETVGEHSGTRADIADLVAESRRAGIAVELVWSGADVADADARARHAVHRVVREGLTNVHKHAPTAPARVEVAHDAGRIRVRVINGAAHGAHRPSGTRHGLVGLEERIELLRGAFSAGPTPGGGFQISAELAAHPAVPAPAANRPLPEVREPLDAEVLTLPRAVGAGCLGLLAVVPVATGLITLIILLAIE